MKSIKPPIYHNWAIRRTKQTYVEINNYFSKLNNREYFASGSWLGEDGIAHTYDFLIFPHINRSTFVVKKIPKEYKEISWEWFQQHILNKKPKKILYEIY